ncbi:MarR family winged helix-turn-helix transcriptional regulator [Dictyobacter arantiisoli]|uniref:MarR family transcriptional regulator n=1 Tax=Dictyobacter arantiisoli TaxID=2014874 RepID=A0A5A5THH1_9CHLR|nr:MarR family transcriptional regulator [Dictyobacter arantiisoli]GCF10817.1 MarR family transcriptional regulator [Dictyobacter arantiisoli]
MPYTSHVNEKIDGIDEKILRLLGLLYRTEKTTEAHINPLLQPIGLTCAQHQVLQHLIMAGEPLPLGLIAEKLHSVRSNVTQMVDRLAAEGLVERVFDPADRRRVLAQITQEGHRRFEAASQLERQVVQELGTYFSQEERDQLIILLSRLEKAWA